MFCYNTRPSRPITTDWTSLVCVRVSLEMEKALCSTNASAELLCSMAWSWCMYPAACHIYTDTKHTNIHTSISIQTTEPHMEKPTVKYTEECVESSVGPLSCGQHKRCFVWVEDSGIQSWSLFDIFEAFNMRLFFCVAWNCPFVPPMSKFHLSESTFTLKTLVILLMLSKQYSTLVFITKYLSASSEHQVRIGLCELLFVASGCFHFEQGHCHCLKVVIYQQQFEATV